MSEHVLHLPNHLDEAKITGSACGKPREGLTFVGTADRCDAYYTRALDCLACSDKICLNCISTPGVCYGETCIYCSGTGVDKTPHGTGGDHCPWCAADWKRNCRCSSFRRGLVLG